MSLLVAFPPIGPLTAPVLTETVRAAQRGDEAAFTALHTAHAARLWALCLALTGEERAAADLVQDTWVRAWEKLADFRGESAFGTWLHRIAVTTALMDRRAGRRRALRVAIEADLASDAPLARVAHDRADDPHQRMDLERAVRALPAGARAVFVLHDLEGYAHLEIAERLGIAEGTSRAQLFRARRLLREALAP